MNHVLSIFILICHDSIAEQLREPPVLQLSDCGGASETKCGTIEFIAHTFSIPPTTFTTRVYKDATDDNLDNIRLGAGPTLIVERGKTYKITLINTLGPESEDNPPFPAILNGMNSPNTTSIHTHGCHISGEQPADYVLEDVIPGATKTYIYSMPEDHAGGMHFYHPHHHGCAALQVGGGAYGAFIIQDDTAADGLADWYVDMPELVAIIGAFDLKWLRGIFSTNVDDLTSAQPETSFYLINGQYQPEIHLIRNEWLKLRLGHIDAQNDVTIDIDSSHCTVYLLGKDGIVLNQTPRLIASNNLYLHGAGRAEIAISCDLPVGETVDILIQNSVIGIFIITNDIGTQLTNLRQFAPIRPTYLTSLIDYTGPWQQYPKGNGGQTQDFFKLSLSQKTVNGKILAIEQVGDTKHNSIVSMTADMAQKWQIKSSGKHPFHIHIHQFQLGEDITSNSMGPTGWSQKGDWVDTITTTVEIRFWAATFGGNVFLHCHNLPHEDLGAVAIAWVNGGCNADMTQTMEDGPPCRFLSGDTGGSSSHVNVVGFNDVIANNDLGELNGDSVKVKHNYNYGYIILVGVIAFILINNVFIGCWCLGKGMNKAYVKMDMVGVDDEI
eukprot:473914_1